jgi:hypothetical protein
MCNSVKRVWRLMINMTLSFGNKGASQLTTHIAAMVLILFKKIFLNNII